MKNQQKQLWFKRKTYGWGWTPSTWQGWMITIIYIILVIGFVVAFGSNSQSKEIIFMLGLPVILFTIALISICYVKGEHPRWQWGTDKNDSK